MPSSRRAGALVGGVLALAAALPAAGQAGTPPSTAWSTPCADRLRTAIDELRAAGVQLPGLTVDTAGGPFGPGATVTLESDDGRLSVVIETWIMGIPADLPWETSGFGECPSDEEIAERWVLRLVRNYAVDRQAQILLRGVSARHGRAVRRILTAALDECAAMP